MTCSPSPIGIVVVTSLIAASQPAAALQPLETFLHGASTFSPDNREARANAASRRAQKSAALGRLLPGLSLRGTYARNQYGTSVTIPADGGAASITITPRDQLDGAATLTVPLVDFANYARRGSASADAAAAGEQARATALTTESLVTQDYFQLVADLGLVKAARRALGVSRTGLDLAETRFRAGGAARLEVDRARADVERQVQNLAAAELQRDLAARSLAARSGVEPEIDGGAAPLADDLHEEPPLEAFQTPDADLPPVAAAALARRAQEGQARAQRLALVPSLSASLTERKTNAAGFSGHDLSYQGVAALVWSFDLTSIANIRAQAALADAAAAREERARLAARDTIYRYWRTVHAAIARSRSARAELEASARAEDLARDRYAVGAATQLDLLQAQRDAFSAEVARAQADAELANARRQLRIAAGRSLLEARPAAAPLGSRQARAEDRDPDIEVRNPSAKGMP
jgi:outer membrane protein TolC